MPRNRTFTSRPEPFSDRDDLQLKQSQVSGPISFFNPTHARYEKIHTSTDDTKPASLSGVHFQWRSRDNRKGRHTVIIPAAAKGPHYPRPTSQPRSVLKGILRMFTTFPWWDVSFLVAFFFSVGCAIFIVCGLFYWLPVAYPSTAFPHESGTAGGITAFVGGTLFTIGAILLMFEAVNENQTGCFGWEVEQLFSHAHTHSPTQQDEKTFTSNQPRITPAKHTCAHIHARHHAFRLPPSPDPSPRPWRWLPTLPELKTHYLHDLGFLGSLAEFSGALIFYINCILALPGVYPHLSQNVLWAVYWLSYLVGGVLFIASSAFYLLETQRNWYTPAPRVLGWWVGVWNMLGSVGWTLAAAFGYCDSHACEYQSDLTLIWASVAFLIGSLILWYEALDKYPVEVEKES